MQVKATGNLRAGSVEITMDFMNNYDKSAVLSLDFGGFEYFGLTDQKGGKYKVYIKSSPFDSKDVNKGYSKISSVQFGDENMDHFTFIEQKFSSSERKSLTLRIDKFDKSVHRITEFHVRAILFRGMWQGDKLYRIEDLEIEWK